MFKVTLPSFQSLLPLFAAVGAFLFLMATPSTAEEDHQDYHETHDDHADHKDHDHDHEHREAGSHQHGVAEIGAALDGGKLAIEFKSPAANIVGFEHNPKDDDQKKAVENAMIVLKNGKTLFVMDDSANCVMSAASVTSPFEEGEDGHDHSHSEDAHAETHSDFSARYLYDCQVPSKLETLKVGLFDIFPSIEKIDAVYLGDDVQLGAELTPAKAVFDLSAQ